VQAESGLFSQEARSLFSPSKLLLLEDELLLDDKK
jgi:hypothetical protein